MPFFLVFLSHCWATGAFIHLQHIIIDVPLLAPLFARMVTPNISKRFTASQAHAFAQSILPTVSSLGPIEREAKSQPVYHRMDLWEGLPPSFVSQWSSHHDNFFSWTMRLQNWLVDKEAMGWYLMYYSRLTMHVLTYLPRLVLRRISSIGNRRGWEACLAYVAHFQRHQSISAFVHYVALDVEKLDILIQRSVDV